MFFICLPSGTGARYTATCDALNDRQAGRWQCPVSDCGQAVVGRSTPARCLIPLNTCGDTLGLVRILLNTTRGPLYAINT
jgi:hypothetical protein